MLKRYTALACIYVLLIFVLPNNTISVQKLALTVFEYKILLVTVAIPSLLAWLAAFYGYARLHEYSQLIKNTTEGNSFKKLATGCAWLAWSLPIPVIFTFALDAFANSHPTFEPTAIILSTYTNLVFTIAAFTLIGIAARALTAQAKLELGKVKSGTIIITFLAGGLLFCYFILNNVDLSSLTSTNNPYFLPLWLVISTVIIPYLYAWFIGLLAALEIVEYSRGIKGVFYRQALNFLVLGLIAVVLNSMALRYVNSTTSRSADLVLNYPLVLTLFFQLLAGAGFLLIAIGANRLKRIEEI